MECGDLSYQIEEHPSAVIPRHFGDMSLWIGAVCGYFIYGLYLGDLPMNGAS